MRYFFLFIFILTIINTAYSQNPLFKNKTNKKTEIKESEENESKKENIIWRNFSLFMAKMYKKLNEKLTTVNDNFTFLNYIILLGISILYGFFHAAGPGHGKSLIVSFFIGNKSKITDGLKVSFMIGIMHTSMGLLLAVLFSSILHGVRGIVKLKIQWIMGVISGVIVIIIGLILLCLHFKHKNEYKNNPAKALNKKNIYGVAIAAGIVPCPMTLAIAMFSFSLGYIFIGLSVITGISIGISLFLLLVSTVTINAVNISFKKFSNNTKLSNNIHNILHIISSFFIIFIGIFIVISSYSTK